MKNRENSQIRFHTFQTCLALMADSMADNWPFLIEGPAGCGKSAIPRCIAANPQHVAAIWGPEHATETPLLIDLRLGQKDGVDIGGQTYVWDGELKNGMPPFVADMWAHDAENSGKPIILFCDELDRAHRLTLGAALGLFYDRLAGPHRMPKGVRIVAAINGRFDAGMINDLGHAVRGRFAQCGLLPSPFEWADYMESIGANPVICAYMRLRGKENGGAGVFFNSDPKRGADIVASPRLWSEAAKKIDKPDSIRFDAIAALVGESLARDIESFLPVFERAGDLIPAILADPATAFCPDPETDLDICFAISGALAHIADADNAEAIIAYAQRLPKEYEIATIAGAARRAGDAFMKNQAYQRHAIANQDIYKQAA